MDNPKFKSNHITMAGHFSLSAKNITNDIE